MMHRKNWKGYLGLSTEEAFDRLFAELGSTLDDYRAEHGWHWKQIVVSSFSPNSHYAILSLCSIAALLIEFLIIIVSFFSTINTNQAWQNLLPEAFTLLFIAIGNSALQIWDNYKRVNELPVKIEKSLEVLKKLVQNVEWDEKNYPDLYMPFSPCITLQWCYRDRKLVNLPWSFLVPGDLIILQPAQKIITKCQLIDAKETVLEAGMYYLPRNSQPTGPPPKLHDSLPSQKAIVIDSPYVAAIKHYLTNMKNQPSTFYNKERFGVVNHLIERIILPTSMMIFICLCLVRFFYLPLWLGIRVSALSELILLQPMTYTLPFIPVGLPLIWYFLHAIGNAKIHMLFQLVRESEFDCSELFDLRIRRVWEEAAGFFMDKEETLHRSQGLLHILASVTALCCVDKKGILSWPNPLADKLFFLHSKPDKTIEPEVLDITHDNSNAFELHFDDPNWQSHLNSLKPLGLNILLNTCNWETMPTYSDFHSYISQEFFSNPNDDLLVPVMGRRCLCEVARIIGFEDRATCCFQLEEELCSFRHIESDEISRGKLTKAKIKFPFPHMMSVVVKERPGMNIQLMAQGTGDLVLDVCEDFWDGQDLRVLTDTERKHILDFYQRTALTSICTAFSYKPLFTKVGRMVASQYTELAPSKGLHFLPYFNHQGTTVSTGCLVSSGLEEIKNTADDVEGSVELQNGQIFLGMVTMQYQACMDMVQLIEQLDSACIRFVHFSKENELRSRVFSEKMGLESGWNCHISLSNRSNPDDETEESGNEDLLGLTGINFGSFHVGVSRTSARLNELRRGSSTSVPELVTLNPNAELTEEQVEADRINSDRIVRFAESCCKLERRHMSVTPTDGCGGGEAYDLVDVPNTPLGFDMSNRAKLPRGIEQVRPHLENVDNVPLLVSLFTDCTAETTTEMVHVMQDYGEVTIVMGSVANVENKRVFSRADACFGVEPLYPQACQKQQVYEPTYSGPTDVAMLMTSMPCSLFFRRNEQLAFYPLIGQARHYMNNCVRNVFQFWCCCQVTMVIFGLVATFVLIPPVYTIGDSIWIVTIIIPAMSLGLAFSVMDRVETDVMSRASWKNHWVLDRQLVMYTFWFYGMKFIPSMLNVIVMAVFNLTWICEHMHNSTCSWVYPVPKVNGTAVSLPCPNNWGCENSPKLLFVQQFSLFFLVLYFVVISSGFVYRSKYLWARSPVSNREWILSSVSIIFIQFLYMLAKLGSVSHFTLVSPLVYVWGFTWTIFAIAFNELLRRQEMKINIRYQKRARLDFGTKLGMNSPF